MMKNRLSMYTSKFRKYSKEEYIKYLFDSWVRIKNCTSICISKLKSMNREQYIKVILIISLLIAFFYFYELFIGVGTIIAIIFFIIKFAENENENQKRRLKEQNLLMEKIQRDNDNKLTELKFRFNAPIAKIVNYSPCQYILVSEEDSLVMLNERIYSFSDIMNFSLSDNSVEVFSPTISTTKTNTGSIVGRAIVGGVLTGGAGAIIGGVTAGKTTETSGGTSHTKHNYTLIITVNNISNPIERIHIGENVDCADELCSLFSIILNRK